MTKAAREVLKQALKLPDGDRVRLARTLLESVDLGDDADEEHELPPEWRAELERRVADDDPASWVSGDEVFRKLREAERWDEGKGKARPAKRRRGA